MSDSIVNSLSLPACPCYWGWHVSNPDTRWLRLIQQPVDRLNQAGGRHQHKNDSQKIKSVGCDQVQSEDTWYSSPPPRRQEYEKCVSMMTASPSSTAAVLGQPSDHICTYQYLDWDHFSVSAISWQGWDQFSISYKIPLSTYFGLSDIACWSCSVSPVTGFVFTWIFTQNTPFMGFVCLL